MRMPALQSRLVFFILSALALQTSLFGQATEGAILGSVMDGSGGVVPGAKISVTSLDTGIARTVTTNGTGEFVVSNIALGRYRVEAEASGFKRGVQSPVSMQIKDRVRVDFTLEVGALSESVQVSGTAQLLQTDSPETGAVVSQEMLRELPVISRNYLELASLAAGTTAGSPSDRRRNVNGAAITVSGASSETNNFIIDGISNNEEFVGAMSVQPPIDAIQEFKVQTAQYSAEFGRAGGGVINIAIKSGTNLFHGFAYDYLGNDALNARGFFDVVKAPLHKNQFGGGLGGPIRKDKWFFFGNYEGLRQSTSAQTLMIVPTALEKKGDFSQSPYTVYQPGPGNRTPFPGNVIPTAQINPTTAKLLSYYPDPNYSAPGIANNYIAFPDNTTTLNSYTGKVDGVLSSVDALTVRYSQQKTVLLTPGWMPANRLGGNGNTGGKNTGLNYTHTFSPRLLNEFRFGYNFSKFGATIAVPDDILSQFHIPGLPFNPPAAGFPQLGIRNISGTGTTRPIPTLGNPFLLTENTFQWLDAVSYQRGAHALKFGAEFVRLRDDRAQGLPGNAYLGFGGEYSSAAVGQRLPNGIADALLGLSDDYDTQYVFDAIRLRSSRFGAYVQDYWRVTKKLSLSLGVRWDVFGAWNELRNRVTNFDFATGKFMVPASTKTSIEALVGGPLPPTFEYAPTSQIVPHTKWLNFAPRAGFAYELNPRMTVRGGYGLFYGVTVANNFSNGGTNAPFFTTLALPGTFDTPVSVANGFPVGGALSVLMSPSLSGYYSPVDRRSPYSQKWNFNFEFSPGKSNVIDIGYVGQHALGFPLLDWFNAPVPGPGSIASRTPLPNVGLVLGYLPVNDSTFNALEISFRQRFFHGLSAQSAFTYGRSYAYESGTDGSIINNPYNFRYDWGPADYDIRSRWVSALIYNLPAAQRLPKALRYVVGNWEASTIVTLQSGLPFSVSQGSDVLNNSLGLNRPNISQDPNLPTGSRSLYRWFDTSVFSNPPLYTFGNEPRNALRGPGLSLVNFAGQKPIPLGEQRRLVLRFEASNLFNHPSFGLPPATFGGANFGVIRSTSTVPRTIQAVAKFEF